MKEKTSHYFFPLFCLFIPGLNPNTEMGVLQSPSTKITSGKIWKDHYKN